MKALFLPLYPPETASSRYRIYQYLPLLRDLGVEPEVYPAPSAALWAAAGASRRGRLALEAAYVRTALARARAAPKYDAVMIQKAVTPSMLRGLASLLRRRCRVLFYDIDDAVYVSPPHQFRGAARLLQRRSEAEELARSADAVLAGSGELVRWAGEVGGNPILLPTCVDADRFAPAAERPSSVVGWIGSPSTAEALSLAAGPLSRACEWTGARFVAVGAGGLPDGVHGESAAWSLEGEAGAVASFAVGIAPLPDTPWNRGKCALKALLYMSCAVPVVASPVGALKEVVVDGETGFLARNDAEWENALVRLLSDGQLRRRMGEAGRQRVLSHYSIGVGAEIMARALRGEVG